MALETLKTSGKMQSWRKEFQPAKAKMDLSYRQLENELAMIAEMEDANAKRKAEIEAEMVKVKKAVEA